MSNVQVERDRDWPLVGSVLWFAIGAETFRPEFYEIVRETAKTVIVERIGQCWITGDVYEGTVVPDRTIRPDKDKTGKAMQYRVKKPTGNDHAFKGKVEWHSTNRLAIWHGRPVASHGELPAPPPLKSDL